MAFETLQLTAITRNQAGKGPSHRLRRAGLVPAIVYSGGKEAISVALEPRETAKVLMTPLRRNVVFTINLQNEKGESLGSKVAMFRDIQVDPVKRHLLHADMMEINPKEEITVPVPMVFIGKSKSVTAGGKLEQVCRGIQIRCMPNAIPEKVELDVTELPFGTTHADLVSLPVGVSLAMPANTPVATIRIPRAEKEEAAPPVAAAATPAAAPVVTTGAAAREANAAAKEGK